MCNETYRGTVEGRGTAAFTRGVRAAQAKNPDASRTALTKAGRAAIERAFRDYTPGTRKAAASFAKTISLAKNFS